MLPVLTELSLHYHCSTKMLLITIDRISQHEISGILHYIRDFGFWMWLFFLLLAVNHFQDSQNNWGQPLMYACVFGIGESNVSA